MILNLVDVKGNIVKDVVYKSKQKNIPLILMGGSVDSKVISDVSKDYTKVVFVTPDLKESGIIEGKILVNLWNTDKKIIDKNNDNIMQYILLRGKKDSAIANERIKYSIENLILKYDGKIEAIISNNDDMAIGSIEALQKYGYNTGNKSKYIAVVGIDGIPEAIDLINKGYMTGTVASSFKSDFSKNKKHQRKLR